jgi:hypothetical protein
MKRLREVCMKTTFSFSIIFVLLLVSGVHAQSNDTIGQCLISLSDFKPVLGAWSEYQVKASDEPISKVRLAVVGKEGQDYWYETVVWAESKTITKLLTSGDPNNVKNVKRMIIKYENEPAVEVPVVGSELLSKVSNHVQDLVSKGAEDIKVPAGDFIAEHFQYQEDGGTVNTWVNDCVSPYALVKSQSKTMEMVLIGYGTGAESLIKEKPKEMKQHIERQETLPDLTPFNINDDYRHY